MGTRYIFRHSGQGGHGSIGHGHGHHHGQHGHHGHHGHGHHGHAFNRWGNSNMNYHTMHGFNNVDYSTGWNNNVHDQMLRNNIEHVFMQYDFNRSGQLEGMEFFNAYRDLCLRMGMAPPMNYQEVRMAAQQFDSNHDGRISKWEMFNIFKRIQGVQGGMFMTGHVGW